METSGPILRRLVRIYEWAVRLAVRRPWVTAAITLGVLVATWALYGFLKQDFLPEMDEGAFVLDYLDATWYGPLRDRSGLNACREDICMTRRKLKPTPVEPEPAWPWPWPSRIPVTS